ncbi:DNA primase [Patescibacteria group bacterium]|nr:DNA primase [Patescibacteria group bacterium]MBU0879626.1 DNA primase [Patescibacteria group bacterium]MBU0880487.1 DNA primase [Patescibacteria group bacterium]MBU1783309.1 DNA primase [Patescibacteria group bacterium]MBU1991993.1 DNA primase [Patescibacteria group bacterium]
MNSSDEIKSKLDIVEVIREYIQLKAVGINFRACCPFHHEKSPSFTVSPEKQIWHCFGCQKGGDVFSFVMEMEGISFVEALRMLASKAGVILKKADPAITSQRNRLLDVSELASKYFHKVLLDSSIAELARQYLKDRGLIEDTINNWAIGYSPDGWENLVNFLKERGFNENEIFLAGLSIKKERSVGFIDRFRGRIMFPLSDVNGNVVGFSARVMPNKEATEKLGKYVNTPQTMIYDKSKILFGLDKAKMAIKREDMAVLVEGQMDAITAHQAGFTNVIASSGTALTADQVAIIKRYSSNLFLAFDMDKAGDLAAERGITQAMQAEMNIKVIKIPLGKDPDEFIKSNADEWPNVIATAKPMMQYYFDKTFVKFDSDQYNDKSHAIKILFPVIAKLGSKIEQDYWIKQLSQITNITEAVLKEDFIELEKKLKNIVPVIVNNRSLVDSKIVKQNREEMLSELLLALIIKHSSQIDYVANRVRSDEIVGEINQAIYKNLIIYYSKIIELQAEQTETFVEEINYRDFSDWMIKQREEFNQAQLAECVSRLNKLVILADKDFYEYGIEQIKAEIINIINVLKKSYLSNRLKEITKLISQVEKTGENFNNREGELKSLMEEFQTLTEEIEELSEI